ncbi:MAG: EscU/YscU/HrcU family type III secretion system export apparatus switch protein [Thermodesulfovibrionales bacterium]|jgi:flagellar biosynthesis protein
MTIREKRFRAAALRYRHGEDSAPKIIAKGKGKVAEKILEIAKKYNIPIQEDRELVEVLSSLDLNREIPPELYRAVAEILAFVYSLSKSASR